MKLYHGSNHFDLVIGPVADDAIYPTVRLYELGQISKTAAIEQFKVNTFFNQYTFSNQETLDLLLFEKSEVYNG